MSDKHSGDRQRAEVRSAREERMGRNSIRERGSDSRYERSRLNEFFLNGDGVDRGVLQKEICNYLGPEAFCRPSNYRGIEGYVITAARPFTSTMIEELEEISNEYRAERYRGWRQGSIPTSYENSETYKRRSLVLGQGTSASPREQPYQCHTPPLKSITPSSIPLGSNREEISVPDYIVQSRSSQRGKASYSNRERYNKADGIIASPDPPVYDRNTPPNGDSSNTGKELGLSPYQNRQHPDRDRYSQGIQHYPPKPRNLFPSSPYSDSHNAEIREYTPPSIPQPTAPQNNNSYPSPTPSASQSKNTLFCKSCQSQAEAGGAITLCSECRGKMIAMLHRYPQDKSGYESAVAFVSGLLGGAFIAARVVASMWQFPR